MARSFQTLNSLCRGIRNAFGNAFIHVQFTARVLSRTVLFNTLNSWAIPQALVGSSICNTVRLRINDVRLLQDVSCTRVTVRPVTAKDVR